jgi:hypothetical protein
MLKPSGSSSEPEVSQAAAWLESRAREVQRRAEHVLTRHAADDAELVLSLALLHEPSGGLSPARQGFVPAVHLPLLVHAGLTGAEEQALELAAACVLLEAGLCVLDAGSSDELGGTLAHLPRALVALAATSFVSHVAEAVVLELDVEPERKLALLAQLNAGLARMSRGQLLAAKLAAQQAPSADDVEAAVCQNAGERRALYAGLAARLAGATATQLDDYQGFARAFGVAHQLHADLVDLFGEAPGRPLQALSRTLPLALALREPGAAQRERVALLQRARHERGLRAELCARVRQSGALRGTLARKEVYCQRALRLLGTADPMAPAAEALTAAVRGVSLAEAPADFGSLPPPPREES